MKAKGFYRRRNKIKERLGYADFSFLEYEKGCYYTTALEYLHGYCVTFAYILSKKEGYPIVMRKIKNVPKDEPNVIHAWCEYNGEYIDIRGKTSDFKDFWDEFEDFDDFDQEDDRFETLRFADPKEFYMHLKGNTDGVSFGKQKLADAIHLFEKHFDYYKKYDDLFC